MGRLWGHIKNCEGFLDKNFVHVELRNRTNNEKKGKKIWEKKLWPPAPQKFASSLETPPINQLRNGIGISSKWSLHWTTFGQNGTKVILIGGFFLLRERLPWILAPLVEVPRAEWTNWIWNERDRLESHTDIYKSIFIIFRT